MKITADTNVLVRAAVQDNEQQPAIAASVLKEASLVAVPLPVLCEFVWVLNRGYRKTFPEIITAIRYLMDCANVLMNRPAVEAGIAILEAGGDFADGVIAYEGNWLGADQFVSFDKKAVALLQTQGQSARLLTE